MKSLIFLLVVLAIRWLAMRLTVRKRRRMTVHEQRVAFNCSERGIEALRLLSKMYSIDVGYIRPSDPFCKKGILTSYDSWSFNSGYNELEDYVNHNDGEIDDQWVVSDFIRWYELIANKDDE